MFEKYDPLDGRILRILDDEGRVVDSEPAAEISDEKVLDAYRRMLYARIADLRAVSYQRQGRMYTYPPSAGQEAVALGTAMAMEPEDWLVPAYRELGAYFYKGATPQDIYTLWRGCEDGYRFPGARHLLPMSVPIASQTLHAVGIAYAIKYKEQKGIVFVYVGDGGTSEGDFHEALNFAGVWKVPVIFVCQNNQYAISTPATKQTASRSIAVKSIAYGLKGMQVDGNDFLAVHASALCAARHARSTGEAVLLEYITYRLGAHTTADDPTRYRSPEEEERWRCRDPLKRLRSYLISRGLWREGQDAELEDRYGKEIDEQFAKAEAHPYPREDVFRHMYEEMPEDLRRQQMEYEKYLQWRERRWQ